MNQFDTAAARKLADSEPIGHWAGQMRYTLHWMADIIDAANKALEPIRTTDNPGGK